MEKRKLTFSITNLCKKFVFISVSWVNIGGVTIKNSWIFSLSSISIVLNGQVCLFSVKVVKKITIIITWAKL